MKAETHTEYESLARYIDSMDGKAAQPEPITEPADCLGTFRGAMFLFAGEVAIVALALLIKYGWRLL